MSDTYRSNEAQKSGGWVEGVREESAIEQSAYSLGKRVYVELVLAGVSGWVRDGLRASTSGRVRVGVVGRLSEWRSQRVSESFDA